MRKSNSTLSSSLRSSSFSGTPPRRSRSNVATSYPDLTASNTTNNNNSGSKTAATMAVLVVVICALVTLKTIASDVKQIGLVSHEMSQGGGGASTATGHWLRGRRWRAQHQVAKARNVTTTSASGLKWGIPGLLKDKPSPNNINHNRDNDPRSKLTNLIIVAGHSILLSPPSALNPNTDEDAWYLLDYQREKNLPQVFVSHIREGIALAQADKDALLMFTGGEMGKETGPLAEGSSYFRVADMLGLWEAQEEAGEKGQQQQQPQQSEQQLHQQHHQHVHPHVQPHRKLQNEKKKEGTSTIDTPSLLPVRDRTVTEEFSMDSFQNLMFSICRFKEVTGNYPTQITVISFSFKQRRFVQLHAPALRWPSDKFHFVGLDPFVFQDESGNNNGKHTGFNLTEAREGEWKNAALPFETDPYGCHSSILKEKRIERNYSRRQPPYELTCPDMKDLLTWCGPELISPLRVPWIVD